VLPLLCALGCSKGEAVAFDPAEHGSESAVEIGIQAEGEQPPPAATPAGAGDAPSDQPLPAAAAPCTRYAPPEAFGTLPDEVDEASGMVVDSAVEAPFFWLINDSGDLARVYGVNADGTLATTALLDSIIAIDWEDIAGGPCGPDAPDAACVRAAVSRPLQLACDAGP
jgi:hypothetical protein